MGLAMGAVAATPTGSMLAVDERGIGLRATWRLNHGFINVSLWREDRCVETFHLAPRDAARFVTFVAEGLADVATTSRAAPVLTVAPPAAPSDRWGRARAAAANALRSTADRLNRS